MRRQFNIGDETGSVLLPTLIVLLLSVMCISAYLSVAAHDVKMNRRYITYKKAVAAAESGLDRGLLSLRNLIIERAVPTQGELDQITPPTITGFQFVSPNGEPAFNVDIDGAFHENEIIEEGRWAGLIGDYQRYRVRVGATNPEGYGAVLTYGLQRLSIPVFQFGVFYEEDLEILPGPPMTFAGPVHTNQALYVGCNDRLDFDDRVTVRGEVYRHRKDRNAYPSGTVYIMDDNGVYHSMRHNGWYLDHDDESWPVLALQRWDGNFLDVSHNVPYLSLPIPHENVPHEIIERANPDGDPALEGNKFENKADILIWRDGSGDLHGSLADGTPFPLNWQEEEPATETITYETEFMYGTRVLAFDDASEALGTDGDPDSETFVITAENGTDVWVETKAGDNSQWTSLSAPGNSSVDSLGFELEYVARDGNEYSLRVSSHDASQPLDRVLFYFGWDGWIVDPGEGTQTVVRETVIAGESHEVASTDTFGDWREGNGSPKTMESIDIDMAELMAHPAYPGTPEEGVVLYAYSDYEPSGHTAVIRLENGGELPEGGISVATCDPIYIRGDFNDEGETKPSMVAGDAVSILSNNWDDDDSWESLNSRRASNTRVNTVIMTGNTDTEWGQYNGGLENVLRFCESWSGKTLQYRGSILCLWNSTTATGPWVYGNNRYTAPNRDWGYDEMYRNPRNAPPGIPHVYGLEALTWRQDSWTAEERN